MMARKVRGVSVLVGAVAAALLTGCTAETRDRILPYFFDGLTQPARRTNVPTSRVRRDLLAEIAVLKRNLADAQAAANAKDGGAVKHTRLPVEDATNWEDAAKLLPKTARSTVDWVQAIRTKAIRPKPGPDPETPTQAVLELDVELAPASKAFTVVYPHAAHTEWLACANCHPSIFPLTRRAEPLPITMEKIRRGEYCGVCHGKVAFAPDGHCHRCHTRIPATSTWQAPDTATARPIERARTWTDAAKLLPTAIDGSPDWPKALADGIIVPRAGVDPEAQDEPTFPLDVALVPQDAPAMKAVFPHQAHTAVLSCPTCHPAIFQMAAGADPINMTKIFSGEYCGRCHGKVAFPVATGCPRCHPTLAGR